MVASVSNSPTQDGDHDPTIFWVSFDADAGVVGLHGELDAATLPRLVEVFDVAAGYPGELVLDLADLAFIDSVGLGALIRFRNRRAGPYHDLMLRDPQLRVRRILAVTGLDRVFPVSD
jgi:anti-sigma B factor antagonist